MESAGCRASSYLTDRCWILPVVAACVTFAASLVESSRGYLYVLYMEKFNVDHGVASWPDSILVASEQLSGFAITLLQNKLSVFYITILSITACGGGVIAGAFCPNIIWMTVAVGGLYGFFRDTLGSYDNLYAMLGAVNLLAAAMLSILVYRDCAHRKANWTLANCNRPQRPIGECYSADFSSCFRGDTIVY
ncbi:uncharacterized protein LOC119465203 [Dermacentor silvarum]|uniref:uncharacterized protein LOC119465203 n=1 Tax=Dermacentor silvarum TaxID=543639 RepID=UPI001898E644|nr:uncharacterized protein LOC119465203 [Dermacentor silvarum]